MPLPTPPKASINADLVATGQEVRRLCRHLTNGEPPDGIRLLHGWRHQAIGAPLLDLVQGNSEIHLTWHNGTLRAASQ